MELLEKIFNAGVVGAGGAGFPTHIKLNCKVEHFLINAAECEPFLQTDKYVIRNFSNEIVSAILEVRKIIDAKEVFIGIKGVNTVEVESLENALQNTDIKIHLLDNYYPAGDEQALVYDITGKTVHPSGIPLGVKTVVSNVATLLNIYDAINDKPVTHKFLTVTGLVKNPMILKVPIGTSFKDCIDLCEPLLDDDYIIINGGPMMGATFYKDDLHKLFVTKTTSGIIIIKNDNNFIGRLKKSSVRNILNRGKSACIQCTFCTDLCPRNLIGHNIRPHMIMRQMASLNFEDTLTENEILKEAFLCCDCGVCETFACPMGLSPRQVNGYVKRELKNTRYVYNGEKLEGSKVRDYRKIPPQKIIARMGLSEIYDKKAKDFKEFTPSYVSIPLKQHIGIPASPIVSVGDVVSTGQLIGTGDITKPSGNIHASIDGVVKNIDDFILLEGGK